MKVISHEQNIEKPLQQCFFYVLPQTAFGPVLAVTAWHLIDVLIQACCLSGGRELTLCIHGTRDPHKHWRLINAHGSDETAGKREVPIKIHV